MLSQTTAKGALYGIHVTLVHAGPSKSSRSVASIRVAHDWIAGPHASAQENLHSISCMRTQ